MGITGLLPYLRLTMENKKLIKYQGSTVAIDGHSWLYQVAPFFAVDLYYNIPTTKYCDRFKQKINILRQHNITPIIIFDGDALPSKKHTNDIRKEKKEKIRNEIKKLLSENNTRKAHELMKQCVSISKEMLDNVIRMLDIENIKYIVSPYESDAQMCYLQRVGYVDYIITEDSDLIAFGCDKILYKFDNKGVVEFNRSKLKSATDDVFSKNLLEICVLSGCDYLPSVKGIGLKTAHSLFKEAQSLQLAIKKIEFKKEIPQNYLKEFERALITFKEHIVYNPITKKRLHLSGKEHLDDELCYEFLGRLKVDDAEEFARGMRSIEVSQDEIKKIPITINRSIKERKINQRAEVKSKKKVVVDENVYCPLFK